MSLLIRNARVLDPASGTDAVMDVCVENGEIHSMGENINGFPGAEVIDASQQWLIPGAVDLGSWLREPGLDHKATLATETSAAAASGVTTLCYQPEPGASVDNSAQVNLIQDLSDAQGRANVQVIGNITHQLAGETLSNMGGLKRAGCVAVTNGWQPYADLDVMRKAMEYATTHDLTVFVYPLEHALANKGFMHEGAVSTRLGLPGIPAAAETVAVAQTLSLMELTGTRVHFCRLSAAGSVRLLRQAKQSGLAVSADVAAHQLFLTETDLMDYNPLCHVRPPLRAESDRVALLEGLADGTIDAICSDHQPHETDAKLAPFQQTEPGIAGLETLLPLTMRLVEDGTLSGLEALNKITFQPARIIGSEAGRITQNAQADLVLFDPDALWTFTLETMRSQGKNSPFENWAFQGSVSHTFLAGQPVYSAT
ncbi:MAG: Dihydroorotase (EC [uncultured Thiotrichaceae bacterium]|uniref:Dihydroorotase (EC) n=1 Tax=uncultured Thiotrichaceae bacterium TaxID=298394 RepID=A0A6S6SYN9_9GAMM|nr:MAG: Dihydroorotase (EC [uncultured Thiotrichaceae bacterium]